MYKANVTLTPPRHSNLEGCQEDTVFETTDT